MKQPDVFDGEIEVSVFVDDDYARADLYSDGDLLVTGKAKRDPQDEPNRVLASELAIGRALEQLSQRYLRRANGYVKHGDDMRAQRKVQKARRRRSVDKPGEHRAVTKLAKVNWGDLPDPLPIHEWKAGDPVIHRSATAVTGTVTDVQGGTVPVVKVRWNLSSGEAILRYEGAAIIDRHLCPPDRVSEEVSNVVSGV